MTRDDDYTRELLFAFESDPKPSRSYLSLAAPPAELQKELYHAELLADAGYLKKSVPPMGSGVTFRLTNAGHDFIAVIRNDTVWNRVKETGKLAGGVTLKMMADIAVQLAKKELVERYGIAI